MLYERSSRVSTPKPTIQSNGHHRVTAAEIAHALGAKPSGSGWIAHCPLHNDRTPSLTINESVNGKPLLHCQAGCDQEELFRRVIEMTAGSNGNGHRRARVQEIDEPAVRKIETIYQYVDERGKLLYEVVRYKPKDFRQRRPDGHGGHSWKLDGVPRVLYHLPKVVKAKVVYVTEGERDVDTLVALSLVATCNSGGAGKWKDEYSDCLKGKNVVVIGDNDDPGRRHVESVATSVARVARVVKVIQLPDTVKDITEWVAAGGTRAELVQLVKDAPRWQPTAVAPATAAAVFANTDLGNAERLIADHGDNIRWCEAYKSWLVWDGCRWKRDEELAVASLARETVRSMYHAAGDMADADARKALVAHAQRSESRQKIESMMHLARAMCVVTPEKLDQRHWLLNVRNGTIDLKTGALREHHREDLITKLADVEFDREAKCPRWKQFLNEVFQPYPDIIPFLQTAVGYSLTGDTREECFFLLYGTGRNGKGTLIKTTQALLGDYAGTADFSAFVSKRDDGPRDDIANMRGRRFVAAQESREGAPLAESLIKWITGGDRIRARRLYENSIEFDPTAKLWLATNHKPLVKGTDRAIWSRIKLIPFEVSFEDSADRALKQKLLAELPGILAWTVCGCLRWQKQGLQFPESVLKATAEYRGESDQVGRFIQECCVITDNSSVRTKASTLFTSYESWCTANGEEKLSAIMFSRRLSERGLQKYIVHGSTYYRGIRFRTDE